MFGNCQIHINALRALAFWLILEAIPSGAWVLLPPYEVGKRNVPMTLRELCFDTTILALSGTASVTSLLKTLWPILCI